jgi:hypothetical protein
MGLRDDSMIMMQQVWGAPPYVLADTTQVQVSHTNHHYLQHQTNRRVPVLAGCDLLAHVLV